MNVQRREALADNVVGISKSDACGVRKEAGRLRPILVKAEQLVLHGRIGHRARIVHRGSTWAVSDIDETVRDSVRIDYKSNRGVATAVDSEDLRLSVREAAGEVRV